MVCTHRFEQVKSRRGASVAGDETLLLPAVDGTGKEFEKCQHRYPILIPERLDCGTGLRRFALSVIDEECEVPFCEAPVGGLGTALVEHVSPSLYIPQGVLNNVIEMFTSRSLRYLSVDRMRVNRCWLSMVEVGLHQWPFTLLRFPYFCYRLIYAFSWVCHRIEYHESKRQRKVTGAHRPDEVENSCVLGEPSACGSGRG